MSRRTLAIVVLAGLIIGACGSTPPPATPGASAPAATSAPTGQRLTYEPVGRLPSRSTAFWSFGKATELTVPGSYPRQ